MRLERIRWRDVDWARLDAFPDRTIFQTRAWLTFVARTQRAEPVVAALMDGSDTAGYFTGLVVRRYGVRILGAPFPGWTTMYQGFNLADGVPRRAAWRALTPFAFRDLGCLHVEVRDRPTTSADVLGLGFADRPMTTFLIDLTRPEEEILAGMKGACRRGIRKGEANGVIVEEAGDLGFADDYHAQLVDVFAKQGLVPAYGVDRVRELIRCLQPTGHLLLLRARDPEGRCVATGIFPAWGGVMYFWGGASWRRHQVIRPNEVMFWQAMRLGKERGMGSFDFGGGGEYKRKYGGTQVAVPTLAASRFPALDRMRDLARGAFDLRQRALGRLRARTDAENARIAPGAEVAS